MLLPGKSYPVLIPHESSTDAYIWCRHRFGDSGMRTSTWRYDGYLPEERRVGFTFRDEIQAFEFRLRWA